MLFQRITCQHVVAPLFLSRTPAKTIGPLGGGPLHACIGRVSVLMRCSARSVRALFLKGDDDDDEYYGLLLMLRRRETTVEDGMVRWHVLLPGLYAGVRS